MTSPVPPAAPEGVPVTLWFSPSERKTFDVPLDDEDEEYRALPAAAYDALMSRLAAAEGALETLRPWHPTPCPLCGKAWQTLDDPSRIPAIRHLGNCYFARTALGAERGRG